MVVVSNNIVTGISFISMILQKQLSQKKEKKFRSDIYGSLSCAIIISIFLSWEIN
jgi:hypothetical protein